AGGPPWVRRRRSPATSAARVTSWRPRGSVASGSPVDASSECAAGPRRSIGMYALLLLSEVITGAPAEGPVPAETVVAHAKLGFDAVEVRRLDDQENGTYRLAVRVGDGWWNGPGHLVPPHDGHPCHDD